MMMMRRGEADDQRKNRLTAPFLIGHGHFGYYLHVTGNRTATVLSPFPTEERAHRIIKGYFQWQFHGQENFPPLPSTLSRYKVSCKTRAACYKYLQFVREGEETHRAQSGQRVVGASHMGRGRDGGELALSSVAPEL